MTKFNKKAMAFIDQRAADLLESAAMVVQLPGWWTRKAFARTEDGANVSVFSPEACQFCGIGALAVARHDIWRKPGAFSVEMEVEEQAIESLKNELAALTSVGITQFNDRSRDGRRIANVMLDAADKLRAGASA